MTLISRHLKKYASLERKKSNEWFFKTGKGQYGEGDKFIGVRVPDVRKVAKVFSGLGFMEIKKSLGSEIHEERLTALLILVENFKKAKKEKNKKEQSRICKFYLKNLKRVNNWDLVDLSAHYILGQAILDGLEDEKILDKLSISKNIWERRVSIISTFAFIRIGDFKPTLRVAKKLLIDKEDLIHKAIGWMLREVWKKNAKTCEDFLIENYKKLPRTTLRYSIERMEDKERKRFLKGGFRCDKISLGF
ncbi:MAG: DNA alkylation repair protein [Candidatus Levybacteria bacterium CG10_big_fil_rev_8_21_14_0_10_36_7]|nr:MAG: DNA alkylation repair protein [Candidatus Levybacteria bacterium CG10_big_fil_rev_8_21_14_0_10_36_7]